MSIRECIFNLKEAVDIECDSDISCDDEIEIILEADVSSQEQKKIKDEISKLDIEASRDLFSKLHQKLERGKYTSKDGATYHILKMHIKDLTQKETGKKGMPKYWVGKGDNAQKVKAFSVRTESDFKTMANYLDFTPKPVPTELIISIGNLKIGKDTIIFNMGSATHCPSKKLGMCQVCLSRHRDGKVKSGVCYATKAERQYSGDKHSTVRKRMLQAKQWEQKPVEEIAGWMALAIKKQKKPPIRFIRINESGDFGKQKDVDKISDLADLMAGDALVYMYTARKDLDYSGVSDNLVIQGSGFMIHNNFQFVPKEEFDKIPQLLKARNTYLCGGSCLECSYCKTRGNKVVLIEEH
jgi:hypothetical protein